MTAAKLATASQPPWRGLLAHPVYGFFNGDYMRELLNVRHRVGYAKSLARYIDARDWDAEHEWQVSLLWRRLAIEINLLIQEGELWRRLGD